MAKETNTNLQTTNTMDLSMFQTTDGGILGLEEVSAEDIKMPRIKLAQAQSKEVSDEKCKAGQFFNVTTGEAYDSLPVRLLTISKSRVRWPQEFKRGDKPLCRSLDGKTSVDGLICQGCENCQWTGDKRPSCHQSYTWLALLNDDEPFRIAMSGSAIAGTKSFITECARKKIPPFTLKVTLTSEKVSNDKGTFYVPKYEIAKTEDGKYILPTQSEWNSFREAMEGFKEMFKKAVDQDTLTADDSDPTNVDAEEEVF